jgi:AcrR family transcriptional regulator
MTPRSYMPRERQRTVDAGRERILAAAREVLDLDDVRAFSLDAVAKRAGVTRMTVYNQFGSKAGLLAELFDLLMERGAFREMGSVLGEPDVAAAFDGFVSTLGRFYTENRAVLAGLSVAAGVDPDLDEAMRSRHERRRRAIETLVQRLDKNVRPAVRAAELVNVLDVLLAFGTFSSLAGPGRTPKDAVSTIQQLVRATVGMGQPRRRSARKSAARRT